MPPDLATASRSNESADGSQSPCAAIQVAFGYGAAPSRSARRAVNGCQNGRDRSPPRLRWRRVRPRSRRAHRSTRGTLRLAVHRGKHDLRLDPFELLAIPSPQAAKVFHPLGQLLQLRESDCRLQIRELEVEPEHGVLVRPTTGTAFGPPLILISRTRRATPESFVTTAPPWPVVMILEAANEKQAASPNEPSGLPSWREPRASAASSITARPRSRASETSSAIAPPRPLT